MRAQSIGFIASVIAGTVTGALTAYVVTRSARTEPKRIEKTAEATEQVASGQPAAPPGVDSRSALLLDDLQRRLAVLESRGPDAGAAAAAGGTVAPEEVDHLQAHKAAIQAHFSESPDPSWAPRASRSFEQDLTGAASSLGFDVRSVDCRTTSCVATLRFANFDQASKRWADLLHMKYGENCTREVALDVPDDPSAAFETTVLYDCVDARAESL